MPQNHRKYECIVFGATGYTGKYTAEHIAQHLPTDFRWAVAGRSESKLLRLVDELKHVNPDRTQPDVLVAQLLKDDLLRLVKHTAVLITTVGPYHKYGTLVVEACAETGTHYLDVTGETPWTYDTIHQYQATAQASGAIMIPQNGIESVPADLIIWSLVRYIRQTLQTGTEEVVLSIWDMKATPSGGTLATILSMFETYSMSQLEHAQRPWSICPVSPPPQQTSRPILERLSGVRNVQGLGSLTDSIQGPSDIPIIQRSWGLHDGGKYYGQEFRVTAYAKSANFLTAIGFHFALTIFFTAMLLSPFRWLLSKVMYEPGDGPTREQVKHEYCEWRAIAQAEVADPHDPKRAECRMRWNGSMYHLTGVCLAESALILARETTSAHELGGGFLTPSTLGVTYLEKLRKAGLEVDVHMMP